MTKMSTFVNIVFKRFPTSCLEKVSRLDVSTGVILRFHKGSVNEKAMFDIQFIGKKRVILSRCFDHQYF